MTYGIILANKNGIALAIDSLISSGGYSLIDDEVVNKAFDHSKKLFKVSNKIGMQICGKATFMSVMSFDGIIHLFTEKTQNKKFARVEDCVDAFIDFMKNDIRRKVCMRYQYKRLANRLYYDAYNFLYGWVEELEHIKEKDKSIEDKNGISKKIESHKLVKNFSKKRKEEMIKSSILFDMLLDEGIKKVSKIKDLVDIDEFLASKKFEKILTDSIKRATKEFKLKLFPFEACKLKGLLRLQIKKKISSESTNVYIVGYGEKELLPQVIVLRFESFINNQLKFERKMSCTLNPYKDKNSLILPVAQDGMTYLYTNGIDCNYKTMMMNMVKRSLAGTAYVLKLKLKELKKFSNHNTELIVKQAETAAEEIYSEFDKRINDFESKNYSRSAEEIVSILPRKHMAEMAESLVQMAAFKDRFLMKNEKIGGPIDVCTISREHGFCWVKKKEEF